ncbi:MAG TPA: GTPase domain-containing protein [Kofleriaceae bacterium]|nr:GTPase domain-containing protein [Kofleriaceae bacterium]
MAQVDFNERQLTLKLVYFGPPLSGKTTNLRKLHEKVDSMNRGRLMTLETRDDRTLFFDLLPVFFRSNGLSFRIKVYTVPGQPMHEATRRVVLQGADGIVFVAHSDRAHLDANRESWVGLGRNLSELGLRIPVVVQYNKRDLTDCVPLETADRFDDPKRTLHGASAVTGDGVLPTFFAVLGATWDALEPTFKLSQRFGVSREDFMRTVCAHVGGTERDILVA